MFAAAMPLVVFAAPAPSIDACALLDAAQIGKVIGLPVSAGSRHDAGIENNGAWSSSCVWKLSAGADSTRRGFVILNAMQWPVGSGRAHEFLDSFRDAAAQGVLSATPSPRAIGDEALWWGDGLAVRRGDVSFGISVHVSNPSMNTPGAAEQRLAPLILRTLDRRQALSSGSSKPTRS
ncbi:hypothetical protein G7Y82_08315 [Solimonas sp. C16B3]|uniref:DUF3558 domain-containing protein n=2 Tax=Solimonas marina TaxID=2714601 RepID=A0A969WBA6_9GAMM|nr:hypothetical protein [Solimonas marina]